MTKNAIHLYTFQIDNNQFAKNIYFFKCNIKASTTGSLACYNCIIVKIFNNIVLNFITKATYLKNRLSLLYFNEILILCIMGKQLFGTRS